MMFLYESEKHKAVDASTGATLSEYGNREFCHEIGQCYANYEEGDLRFGFFYYVDGERIQFENDQGRLLEPYAYNKATIPACNMIAAYIRAYEQLHHQRPTDSQIDELCERLKSGVIALMQMNRSWNKYVTEWTVTFDTSHVDLFSSRVAAWEQRTGQKLYISIRHR